MTPNRNISSRRRHTPIKRSPVHATTTTRARRRRPNINAADLPRERIVRVRLWIFILHVSRGHIRRPPTTSIRWPALGKTATVLGLGVWVRDPTSAVGGVSLEILVLAKRFRPGTATAIRVPLKKPVAACSRRRSFDFGSRGALHPHMDHGVLAQSPAGRRGPVCAARADIAIAADSVGFGWSLLLWFWRPGFDGKVVRGVDFLAVPVDDGTLGFLPRWLSAGTRMVGGVRRGAHG